MSENENITSLFGTESESQTSAWDEIDLGSSGGSPEFDPFADFQTADDADSGQPDEETPSAEPETRKETPKETEDSKGGVDSDDAVNPLAAALTEADNKQAKSTQESLVEKPPQFVFAGAAEDISDTSKTFEELRIDKAKDFPELTDGKRVSWTVEYAKITKAISEPQSTSIGKIKSEIETSKAFLDALKKMKTTDREKITCQVKPRVTAQSKGQKSSYKGVFTSLEELGASGKIISILPARDGNVYEIRNTDMGVFVTPVKDCEELSEVKAGFLPALPLIPSDTLRQIISFFRYFMREGTESEALVNIYWDRQEQRFIAVPPEQTVSKASVNASLNSDYQDERFIHYLDIHSHNSMKAFFSPVDDRDEKATRVYAVMGRLDRYLPELKVRISNGGKFLPIDPSLVFEGIGMVFPDEWTEKVKLSDSCELQKRYELSHGGGYI